MLFLSFGVFEVVCVGISKDGRYSRYSTEFEESMEWLAALKRNGIEHSPGFAVSASSLKLCYGVAFEAEVEVEVEVEGRGSNLGVEVVSIGL